MLATHPMSHHLWTTYKGQPNSRSLSPRLWNAARGVAQSPEGTFNGYGWFDDFLSFGNITVTTAAGQLQPPFGMHAYIEVDATVGSIKNLATEVGGVIKLLTSTDATDGDNHQTSLGMGANVGTMFKITDTAGSEKALIFEARFRLPSVTNGDGSVFIGLGEEALGAAATPLADSSGHVLASKDLIGFVVFEDDNDALKFVYRKAGQATVTVMTWGTALAANTWYKVGFIYDPDHADTNKKIRIFINNTEQSTGVTATNIAAATFPDDEELTMYASIIASGDNDPQSFDLDWWAAWQAA